MASADVEKPTEPAPAPAVPDYLASPNAVFGDEGVKWRYGRAPDYSKTRKVWEESKHPSSMTLLTHGRGTVWQAHGFGVTCHAFQTPCGKTITRSARDGRWCNNMNQVS